MDRIPAEAAAAPEVELRQASIAAEGSAGCWSVAWNIANKGSDSLEILSVQLPHGQFKSNGQRFDPPLKLASGSSGRFRVSVRCHEPPGPVTENAFLIFSVNWRGNAWRIFVRVRVVVGTDGVPQAATQLITTQKVGFSGVVS